MVFFPGKDTAVPALTSPSASHLADRAAFLCLAFVTAAAVAAVAVFCATFLVIGAVKTAALEKNASAFADQPSELAAAFPAGPEAL
jgi:hypothetical protein